MKIGDCVRDARYGLGTVVWIDKHRSYAHVKFDEHPVPGTVEQGKLMIVRRP